MLQKNEKGIKSVILEKQTALGSVDLCSNSQANEVDISLGIREKLLERGEVKTVLPTGSCAAPWVRSPNYLHL